jgi:hypothetical protein
MITSFVDDKRIKIGKKKKKHVRFKSCPTLQKSEGSVQVGLKAHIHNCKFAGLWSQPST